MYHDTPMTWVILKCYRIRSVQMSNDLKKKNGMEKNKRKLIGDKFVEVD